MSKRRDPELEWGSFGWQGSILVPTSGHWGHAVLNVPKPPYRGLPQLSLLTSDVPRFPFIRVRSLNEASPPKSPLRPALPVARQGGSHPTCSPATEGQVHDSSLLVPAPIVTFRHQALAKQSGRDRNGVPERRRDVGGLLSGLRVTLGLRKRLWDLMGWWLPYSVDVARP